MFPQSLLLSAPYTPSFLKDARPKGLVQNLLLQRKSLQGSAKAIGVQCYTELPWLRLHCLLQRMVPYARLLKPVFSACKPFLTYQRALKVSKRDPYLPLQVPIPPPFYLWHRG